MKPGVSLNGWYVALHECHSCSKQTLRNTVPVLSWHRQLRPVCHSSRPVLVRVLVVHVQTTEKENLNKVRLESNQSIKFHTEKMNIKFFFCANIYVKLDLELFAMAPGCCHPCSL